MEKVKHDEIKEVVLEALQNNKYDWWSIEVAKPRTGEIRINIVLMPKKPCEAEPETEEEKKMKREYNSLFNKHGLFWK